MHAGRGLHGLGVCLRDALLQRQGRGVLCEHQLVCVHRPALGLQGFPYKAVKNTEYVQSVRII